MKNKKILIILFLLTAAMNFSLFGQGIKLSKGAHTAAWPSIAANNKGEVMVVYADEFEGGGGDIFYTISRDQGKTWDPPERTHSWKLGVKSCSLAAGPRGGFHLVYSDGSSSANRQIYYRYYFGGKWESTEQLSFIQDNSNWANVAVDGDNVYVAWYQEVGWPKKPVIAFKAKKIGGTFPIHYEDASNNTLNGAIYPDIAAKNDRIYIIFQVQEYSGTTSLKDKYIGFNEKKADGYWGIPQKIGRYTWPAITADDFDMVHCIYPNYGKVIYNARLGEDWEGDSSINTKAGWDGWNDITYKNNILAACYVATTTRESTHSTIWYRIRKYDGIWGKWENAVEAEPAGYDVSLPKIDIDNYGYLHIICLDKEWGDRNQLWYYRFLVGTPVYLQADKSSLSFEESGTQTFQIKTLAEKSLKFWSETDQDWIECSPKKGRVTKEWQPITVTVDASGLTTGEYKGKVKIFVEEDEENPLEIQINLTVTLPSIELSKSSIPFEAVELGDNPAKKVFEIKNAGVETLDYNISVSYLSGETDWITVTPTSGSSTGESDTISVKVDITSLIEGEYQATIDVTSPRADNSPQKVEVTLTVLAPPIYAPLNFSVEKIENISLFHRETIHNCKWQANPDNKMIIQYKLYWEYTSNGETIRKTAELDSNVFSYEIRNVDRDKDIDYYLIAVDYQNREGEPADYSVKKD